MTTEHGLRSRYSNGATSAERLVAAAGDAKCWHPVAEAVMVRECSDWVELRSDEATK